MRPSIPSSRGFGSVRTIHPSSSSSSVSTNDSLLTVFQADPLAYLEKDGFHPVPVLDFESERQLLTESLTDNVINVDVSFDIATVERLGRFLAKGEGRVLHFSGHGHPEYLAVENGWGAMHMFPVDDLRDFIQQGGDALKFVFVSACYSRSAGEAFLEAGVKHVVCCQQDDQPILNVSCVNFARAFYQALASGRVLRLAFEFAVQQVLNCPHLPRTQRLEEAKKFVLLPEGADHDVTIFEPSHSSPHFSPLRRSSQSSIQHSSRVLPVPPHVFTGRQVETYRVLDGLKSARVVRVTGPVGVGKGSVVQKVCRYILDRQESCMSEIGDILWLPPVRNEAEDELSRMIDAFSTVFYGTEDDEACNPCHQKLLNYLYENKALLVIDARKVKTLRCLEKIALFLHDVIYHTKHTRVIIIHHIGEGIIQKLPCKELNVYLDPLDFLSTIRLFGNLSPFVFDRRHPEVSSATELCNLIFPAGSATDKPRSRRARDIFRMVGEGIPDQIHDSAKNMTDDEYDRLISLGKRKEQVLEYSSRSALEKELSELSLEVTKAVEEKRWDDANECQHRLDEMEILRETLHDLPTLKSLASSLECDLELASSARDFSSCAGLQQELDAIEDKIRIEKLAMEELGIEDEDTKLPAEKKLGHETRVDLELEISALDQELEKACDKNDFAHARQLDAQIKVLKEWRLSLPTRNELIAEVKEIQSSLKQAKFARDWDLAESLYARVQELQKQIDGESTALSQVSGGGSEKTPSDFESALPGAVAVSSKPSASADPRGNHVSEMVNEGIEEDISGLPVALAVHSPTDSASASLRPPGAADLDRFPRKQENEEETEPNHNDGNALAVGATLSNPSNVSEEQYTHIPTQTSIMSQQLQQEGIEPAQAAARIGRVVQARSSRLRSTQAAAQKGRDVQARLSNRFRSTNEAPGHPPRQNPLRNPSGIRSETHMESSLEESNNHSNNQSNPMLESVIAAELHDEQNQEASVSPQLAVSAHVEQDQDASISPRLPATAQVSEDVLRQLSSRAEDPPAVNMFQQQRPQFGTMPMEHGYGDMGLEGGSFPMGHTNRLVLEQMIQESIANMAVPAVKVEAMGMPQPQKKKKTIRTLFGMRKGFN